MLRVYSLKSQGIQQDWLPNNWAEQGYKILQWFLELPVNYSKITLTLSTQLLDCSYKYQCFLLVKWNPRMKC